MLYLTMTHTNLKLQLRPGLVASYDISQETEWVYSHTHTHTFTYLLAPDLLAKKGRTRSD